jgi:hypothetical protein
MVQTAKIKNEAGHQAIHIPDNLKLEGEEVYIKKKVMHCIYFH